MRLSFGGVAGLDLPACLRLLAACGIPEPIAAILLPYWEAGILAAYEDLREDAPT